MHLLSRTTKRLTLIATTVEHLRAEITSHEQLAQLLNARVPGGWPPGEYDSSAQELFLTRMLECGENAVGWFGWYALTQEHLSRSPVLIAAGGFLGPPSDSGDIEMGYSVHDHWRNQGFATELVRELVTFAFENPSVRRIVAHTTTDNVASCKVLKNCSFTNSGASLDPPAIEFELMRTRVPG